MATRPKINQYEVSKVSPSLGAEVRGISLAHAGPAEAEEILDLLHEHLVLFFPGQYMTTEEHIEFGKHFGHIEGHPNVRNRTPYPEILELVGSRGGVADEWHSDLTFQSEPSILSILRVVTCPDVGGDTMWANMYKAYDELSAPLRDLCEGLTALHDAHPHNRADVMATHPVVRIHPVTRRKSLFVNEHFTRRIVEMSHEESELLLNYLTRWVSSPQFTVRYQWSEGTVAIWDNRCTQHFVLDDFDGERIIQRVTVVGDVPEAASSPRWEPHIHEKGATRRHDRQLRDFLRSASDTPADNTVQGM
ncbi:MAG: TauD/TfdA family dioxygenase [Gammaproteobacteria bacterium]|nr:TauD/TfdA family dioxygenase [Gammaproteobacteria bacterium]